MRFAIFLSLCVSLSQTSMTDHCPDYKSVEATSAMKESSTTPSGETPRCDLTSGFNPPGANHDWFRLHDGGTAFQTTGITNHHPQRTRICGTTYPGWIQGKVPSHFGVTAGRLCYNNPPAGFTCPEKFDCHDYIDVDIYNCAGQFLLYHLHIPPTSGPPVNCAKAFCTTNMNPCYLGGYRTVTTFPEMTVTHRLKPESSARCDETDDYIDGQTWIRLQGSGGTEIVNEEPSSNTGICGTTYAGWIIGSKPTQNGIATRNTLCYSRGADGECTNERPIDVMNCRPNDDEYADERTWWLIEGSHGVRVISRTKPTQRENQENPGWMEGTVPKVTDGIVQRKLCYFDGSSTACPHPRKIEVANCGSFLLYRFFKASTPERAAFRIEQLPPDPCYYLPCQRGGTCIPHDNKACYRCMCPSGVTGNNCDADDTNECAGNPCRNGGTCYDDIEKYTCVCATGFTGTNCETEINKCTPNPCENDGTCIKRGDSYICDCPDSYRGDNCEIRDTTDGCNPNPCQNFGECTDGNCQCKFGWTGKTCENDEEIEQRMNAIGAYYDDDNSSDNGCGFWCWLGGLFGAIGGALAALLPALGGLLTGATGALSAFGGGASGAVGPASSLGTSLGNFNSNNNPSNPNTRCPRQNAGSGLQGMKSGFDKCKQKYENKQCTIREKAKPEKPKKSDKPNPTEAPSTEQPTEQPTTKPTEEPATTCSATCSAVQDPEHGQKIGDKTSCGDSVRFNCESGYKLFGCEEPQCKITCQHDGQWSSQPPSCVKASCGRLITLSASNPSHEIEKSASSSTTDCNWAIVSEIPSAIAIHFIEFNFPDLISSQDSCQDYVEIVVGTRRERYCGEKPTDDVIIDNGGLIRFHSSSPSSHFRFGLELHTSCPLSSDSARRTGTSCKCMVSSSPSSNEWPANLPILYNAPGTIKQPIIPKKSSIVKLSFDQGETVIARCSNTEFSNFPGEVEVQVECNSNGKFKVTVPGPPSGTTAGLKLKDISCKNLPTPEIWENSNKLHIGWKKNEITQLTITYDNPNKRPFYVEHTIFGQIANRKENDKPRPNKFNELKNYLKSKKYPTATVNILTASYKDVPENGFKIKEQYDHIDGINRGFGAKYIDCCEGAKYLVRGHLAPNADFWFQSWRDATFFMVNVAPQWQGINAGNWFYLEEQIRVYASTRNTDIKIYTGVHGKLELEDCEITLTKDNAPVPTHFWKIVYDHDLNAAVAFVVLNNPYATLDGDNYPIGDDKICQTQCSFLDKGQDPAKGILMCCSYDDFKNGIKAANLPVLPADYTNLFEKPETDGFKAELKRKTTPSTKS